MGFPRTDIGRASIQGGRGSATAFTASRHGTVLFEDLQATARLAQSDLPRRYGVVTMLAISLRDGETVLGVLSVHWRSVYRPTPDDEQLVTDVGQALAEILSHSDRDALALAHLIR